MRDVNTYQFQRGAGALLSVLIISSALLLLVSLASIRVALLSVSLENSEAYTVARAAAWSCIDMARMRLVIDPQRFENGPVRVTLPHGAFCTIKSAMVTETTAELHVEGNSSTSYVTFVVTTIRPSSTAPFSIETWKEY